MSTKLICLESKIEGINLRYLRYINISRLDHSLALMTYIMGVCFGALIAVAIWLVSNETLLELDLFEKTKDFTEKNYRINWTIEILLAYSLISIGYWRVIYRPIKNISVI